MPSKKKSVKKKTASKPAAKKSGVPNIAAEVKALTAAAQNLRKPGAALIKITGGKFRALRSTPPVIKAVQALVKIAGSIERQLTPPTTTIQQNSNG